MGEKNLSRYYTGSNTGPYPYGYGQGIISTNQLYATGNATHIISDEEFKPKPQFHIHNNKRVKLFY